VIVEVKLFAAVRQYAESDLLSVEVADGATIGELREALASKCPSLSPLLASSMIAVNHEYVRDDAPVPANAEIALIPPVSGG